MSTLVGMQLNGRYRLDAQIGAGGMSTVYRAFDEVLERSRRGQAHAPRDRRATRDQLERFRREARSVAQLSHPHVVGVIDAGEDGGPTRTSCSSTSRARRSRTASAAWARCPSTEAIAYAIEIGRALSAAARTASSSTATSSPRTS